MYLDEKADTVLVVIKCGEGLGFLRSTPWSEQAAASAQALLQSDEDYLADQYIKEDPENEDKYEKRKIITHINTRDISIPDSSIKVVGLNMSDDASESPESPVSGTTDHLRDYLKFSSIEA